MLLLPGWLLLLLIVSVLLLVLSRLLLVLGRKELVEVRRCCVRISIVLHWLRGGHASEDRLVLLLNWLCLLLILLWVWVLWLLDVFIHIKWIVLKHASMLFFFLMC